MGDGLGYLLALLVRVQTVHATPASQVSMCRQSGVCWQDVCWQLCVSKDEPFKRLWVHLTIGMRDWLGLPCGSPETQQHASSCSLLAHDSSTTAGRHRQALAWAGKEVSWHENANGSVHKKEAVCTSCCEWLCSDCTHSWSLVRLYMSQCMNEAVQMAQRTVQGQSSFG